MTAPLPTDAPQLLRRRVPHYTGRGSVEDEDERELWILLNNTRRRIAPNPALACDKHPIPVIARLEAFATRTDHLSMWLFYGISVRWTLYCSNEVFSALMQQGPRERAFAHLIDRTMVRVARATRPEPYANFTKHNGWTNVATLYLLLLSYDSPTHGAAVLHANWHEARFLGDLVLSQIVPEPLYFGLTESGEPMVLRDAHHTDGLLDQLQWATTVAQHDYYERIWTWANASINADLSSELLFNRLEAQWHDAQQPRAVARVEPVPPVAILSGKVPSIRLDTVWYSAQQLRDAARVEPAPPAAAPVPIEVTWCRATHRLDIAGDEPVPFAVERSTSVRPPPTLMWRFPEHPHVVARDKPVPFATAGPTPVRPPPAPPLTTHDDVSCVVCLEAPRTHLAAPCGHKHYCGTCIAALNVCALCKQPIALRVRVFGD